MMGHAPVAPAMRRARERTVAAGTPVMAWAASGGKCRTYVRELLETVAPTRRQFGVEQLLIEQDIDQAESERPVGAGPDGDPLCARARHGLGATRIDDHHVGAALRCRFEPVHVEGRRVGGGIGAPHHQQLGVLDVREHVDQHAAERDVRRDHGERHVAERPHSHRIGRAIAEQDARGRRDRDALGLEHVAQAQLEAATARVNGGCLGPRLRAHAFEPAHNQAIGLFPGDPLEVVGALRPLALQRIAQPVLGIDDLGSVLSAAADHAERMAGVGAHLHQPAAREGHLHEAPRRTDAAQASLPCGLGSVGRGGRSGPGAIWHRSFSHALPRLRARAAAGAGPWE